MVFLKFYKNYFIFDENQGIISKVSFEIYKLLKNFEKLNYNLQAFKNYIKKIRNPKKQQIASQLLKEIKIAREKFGLFYKNKLSEIKFPYPISEDSLKKLYYKKVKRVIFDLTNNCNLRCKYCVYGQHYPYHIPYSPKSIKKEIIKKTLDYLKEWRDPQNFSIGFYGGEPLLEFELIKYTVNYTKNWQNVIYSITTNGTLLDKEKIEFFAKHDFILNISLDGPKEIHDRYRHYPNGKGTFEVIIKNLSYIEKNYVEYAKKRLGFSVVISPPYDLYALKTFFNELSERFAGILDLSLVNPSDTTFYKQFPKNVIGEFTKQKEELFLDFLKIVKNKKKIPHFYEVLFVREMLELNKTRINRDNSLYPNGICLPGRVRLFVGTNGKFYICEKIPYTMEIGDYKNGFDFKKIKYIISEYLKFTEKCKKCWVRTLCNLCYVSTIRGNKFSKEKRENSCSSMKNGMEYLLPRFGYVKYIAPNIFDKYIT